MEYQAISADSHVHEPPNTFRDRVPARLRDMAPHVVPGSSGGEAWEIDGKQERAFGSGVLGKGLARGPEEYLDGLMFSEVAIGSWDPAVHIEDMKTDGADASVLYSGMAAKCHDIKDKDLRLGCLRAYNDWLAEFCSYDPKRLIGIALLPVEEETLDEALSELQRVLKLGYRSVEVPMFPHKRYHDRFYDPLWEAIQSADISVSVHRGARQPASLGGGWEGPWVPNHILWDFSYTVPLGDFIFGVFDRFPNLRLVSGEGRIGWLPFLLERLDDSYRRHRQHRNLPTLKRRPSEYGRSNIFSTFVEDRAGVILRHEVGIDNIMWSSDYPHPDSTWPNSRKSIDMQFEGVPEEDRRKMLFLNAVNLYKLN